MWKEYRATVHLRREWDTPRAVRSEMKMLNLVHSKRRKRRAKQQSCFHAEQNELHYFPGSNRSSFKNYPNNLIEKAANFRLR
jgi:hypothetical protein